jgi:hypothetical protein
MIDNTAHVGKEGQRMITAGGTDEASLKEGKLKTNKIRDFKQGSGKKDRSY